MTDAELIIRGSPAAVHYVASLAACGTHEIVRLTVETGLCQSPEEAKIEQQLRDEFIGQVPQLDLLELKQRVSAADPELEIEYNPPEGSI